MHKTYLQAISLLLGASFLCHQSTFAQTPTNTFPTTGNVGIGTATPAGSLSFTDVTNTTNPVGITWYSGTSGTADPTLYGIHRTAGSWVGPNYQQIRIGWGTGIILDPGTAYPASFVAIPNGGLRVTGGNVGIGNVVPAYPLDVVGTTRLNGTVYLGTPTTNGTLVMNSSAAANFSMTTGGSTNSAFGIYAYGGNNGSNYCQFGNNQAAIMLDTRAGIAPYRFYIGTTNDAMDIFANGDVGIATADVDGGFKLDINGTARAQAGVRFSGLTSDNTQTKVVVGDANGNLFYRDAATLGGSGSAGWGLTGNTAVNPTTTFLGTTDGSTVAFRTSNLERMRIDGATGNVGIGESSPQSLLAVKGTITSQKVVVTQTGWADYVFQPDYRLRPLKEVEEFIKTNGHLPELPTAAEVIKSGDDLGASQVALLKKVEELTLYTIAQDKKAKEQDQQLQEQARQLQAQQARLERLERLIGQAKETNLAGQAKETNLAGQAKETNLAGQAKETKE